LIGLDKPFEFVEFVVNGSFAADQDVAATLAVMRTRSSSEGYTFGVTG